MQRADEEAEVERDAEEREAGDQQAGDRAGAERELKPAGERTDRRLRGAHVGAHRNVHADETRGARQNGADREADADQPAEEIADDHEDHDADDGDRGVLPPQIGLRALVHGRGDLLHLLAAGVGLHHRIGGPDGVGDRQHAAQNDEPQGMHCNVPGCLEGPDVAGPEGKAPRAHMHAFAQIGADIAKYAPAMQRQ